MSLVVEILHSQRNQESGLGFFFAASIHSAAAGTESRSSS